MSTWNPTKGGPDSSRRRSQRVILGVPITVFSEEPNKNAAFEEETQTLVVNVHGAMIGLAAKVVKDQLLRMRNRATREEKVCRVVYLGPASGGKTQVGVEFTSPGPDFWRIAFPPENWNAAEQASASRKTKQP